MLLSATAHKYYLSVTDVVYNEESGSIQMITRLFYDDLEAVLKERYDESIRIDATEDQEELDRYIEKYVAIKLKLAINGEDQKITYVGMEYEDDYAVVYTEVPNIKSIKSLHIENLLLTDLFTEQKNMMHTTFSKKKKSFLLTLGNANAVLNFSE